MPCALLVEMLHAIPTLSSQPSPTWQTIHSDRAEWGKIFAARVASPHTLKWRRRTAADKATASLTLSRRSSSSATSFGADRAPARGVPLISSGAVASLTSDDLSASGQFERPTF